MIRFVKIISLANNVADPAVSKNPNTFTYREESFFSTMIYG
jgi:hypothetical protein